MYYASRKQNMQSRKCRERLCELFIGESLRKLWTACESLRKRAKSVPSTKTCESALAQKAARENQNVSRESVAKGTCERGAH